MDCLLSVPHSPPVTSGDVWRHQTLPVVKWYTGISLRNGQPVAVDEFAHVGTRNGASKRPNFMTMNMLSGAKGLLK